MIKRILLLLVLSLGGAWAVRAFLVEGIWVASGSMEPTLPVGTHYFVNKAVYRLHPPRRGDIVAFKSPVDEKEGYIKRVIAIGGDQVEIRSKRVFLNGSALSEPYTTYKRASERLVGDTVPPVTVPRECVFMLGDDRDESEDSSTWRDPKTGDPIYFVKLENIQGRLMRP